MSERALRLRISRITNIDKMRSFLKVGLALTMCCHLNTVCAA